MAERLRELRNARGVAKRQITLLERFLDARSPDTSIYVIEARFETLTTIKADFETVQKELERLDPTELVEPEDGQLNERESFENRFIQVKASFQQILRENPDSSFNPSHNSTIVELGADLPKFDIPEFHGGYGEYNTFMDIFDTLVHNSPARSMTNVKRMGYLKGACKGRASDVIKHLQLTNENYEVARSLLKERFSNPRLTFQECIDKIWDVPKASSASSLRAVSDLFNSQLKALERLGTREEIADGILIHLALSKFDSTSKSKWEEHLASSTAIPKWDNLIKFLNKRCTVWEAIEVTKIPIKNSSPTQKNKPSEHLKRNYAISSENPKCLMCQSNCADLVNCKKFMDLAPKKRSTLARQWNLCYTCLQPKHETDCTSPNCSHCGRNHHTILHYGKIPSNHVVPHDVTTQSVSIAKIRVSDAWKRNKKTNVNKNVQIESTFVDLNKNYCFLATAVVLVKNNFGDYVPMRVLLDGAAQTSFITAKAAKCLGLPQLQTHVQVAGVHGNPKLLTKAVKLEIKSRLSESTDWNIPSNIQLADPKFNVPQEIDILINAHLTYEWQFVGQIKLGKDKPIAQKTMLGWVIVGSLHATMEKFWSVEELIAPAKKFTKEERECEIHFQNNVQRTDDGRIVVRLPFKINPEQLGHSYDIAKRRLYQISRKFTQDCQMSQHYHQFMQEYQELGHMKSSTAVRHSYYIPHFSVLNPGSTTTSFRVVFDASAATETGLSLNDALMVGPCIQRELFTHLLTFRCKPIALTGDISKMYRQIAIHEDDQKWQKILWYKNNHLQEFQLTTVTYGTASASFLATRALQYLADQEDIMLTGANAIRDNMYVDDLITCANTVDEAIQIYREVTAILKKGQMPIRKFCSNSSDVLAAIPSELHGTKLQVGDKDLKVFGYVARFLNNVRNKKRPITRWKTNDPLPQSLSTHELHEGLKTAVKIVQRHHFQPIIDAILKKEKIDKRHPIARLHPVVGTDGILRVGGRLYTLNKHMFSGLL
uniref:CSON003512 protein n=1 Tax=Culicoides sonorensis TaxID=179676 RepID=A0A336KCY2_CULSO